MEEIGIVESIENGMATIVTTMPEECGTCKSSCDSKKPDNKVSVDIAGFKDIKVGDRVAVEIPSSNVLKACFLLYILPLLIFIGFAVLAFGLTDNTLISAISAIASIIISYIVIGKYFNSNPAFIPKVRILGTSPN